MLRRSRESDTEEPESFDKDDEKSLQLDVGLSPGTALHTRAQVAVMVRRVLQNASVQPKNLCDGLAKGVYAAFKCIKGKEVILVLCAALLKPGLN